MMSRRSGLVAAVVVLVLSTTTSVSASPRNRGSAALEGCRERFVIVPGDDDAVRARVPAKYELARDSSGHPLLYVAAIRCERFVIGATSRPTTAAAFAVLIQPPDGVGCASRWPVVGEVKGDALSCNLYVLFAAYDNRAVVSWLRAGTPDLSVHYVRSLDFREASVDLGALERRLEFRAGPRTPSPYRLDAVVHERPVTTPFTATFWAETSSGTIRIRFESDALSLGEAQGTVNAAPGTAMASLVGSESRSGARPYNLIAGNRWAQGTLTKTVLGP